MAGDVLITNSDCLPAEIAWWSCDAFQNAASDSVVALVARAQSKAYLLGAYDRCAGADEQLPSFRRASGGPVVSIGPSQVYVGFSLPQCSAWTSCDASRLLNRYVRPVARALARLGVKANYFGREWLSVDHRPIAQISFAHDEASGRALVECVIGIDEPYTDAAMRESWRGKTPTTLSAVLGRSVAFEDVCESIHVACEDFSGRSLVQGSHLLSGVAPALGPEPVWDFSVDEALGIFAARRCEDGRIQLGGEFMASAELVKQLEFALSEAGYANTILAAIEAIVSASHGTLFGVVQSDTFRRLTDWTANSRD